MLLFHGKSQYRSLVLCRPLPGLQFIITLNPTLTRRAIELSPLNRGARISSFGIRNPYFLLGFLRDRKGQGVSVSFGFVQRGKLDAGLRYAAAICTRYRDNEVLNADELVELGHVA